MLGALHRIGPRPAPGEALFGLQQPMKHDQLAHQLIEGLIGSLQSGSVTASTGARAWPPRSPGVIRRGSAILASGQAPLAPTRIILGSLLTTWSWRMTSTTSMGPKAARSRRRAASWSSSTSGTNPSWPERQRPCRRCFNRRTPPAARGSQPRAFASQIATAPGPPAGLPPRPAYRSTSESAAAGSAAQAVFKAEAIGTQGEQQATQLVELPALLDLGRGRSGPAPAPARWRPAPCRRSVRRNRPTGPPLVPANGPPNRCEAACIVY